MQEPDVYRLFHSPGNRRNGGFAFKVIALSNQIRSNSNLIFALRISAGLDAAAAISRIGSPLNTYIYAAFSMSVNIGGNERVPPASKVGQDSSAPTELPKTIMKQDAGLRSLDHCMLSPLYCQLPSNPIAR